MAITYLVDYENTNETKLIPVIPLLTRDDHLTIFYTGEPKISFTTMAAIPCKTTLKKVPSGKQVLDMHIITCIGYILGNDPSASIRVISDDEHFEIISNFWRTEKQYDVAEIRPKEFMSWEPKVAKGSAVENCSSSVKGNNTVSSPTSQGKTAEKPVKKASSSESESKTAPIIDPKTKFCNELSDALKTVQSSTSKINTAIKHIMSKIDDSSPGKSIQDELLKTYGKENGQKYWSAVSSLVSEYVVIKNNSGISSPTPVPNVSSEKKIMPVKSSKEKVALNNEIAKALSQASIKSKYVGRVLTVIMQFVDKPDPLTNISYNLNVEFGKDGEKYWNIARPILERSLMLEG